MDDSADGNGFFARKGYDIGRAISFCHSLLRRHYVPEKRFLLPVGIAILAGGFFAPYPTLFTIAAEVSIFYLLYRGLSSFGKTELSYAPVMVFTSAFMVNLFTVLIGPSFTWYAVLMMTIDAVLSFVLTLVFIQAIPVFTYRKKNVNLRSEEILCLIILLASVMTGAVGFTVYNLSAENVLSRYLILVFALVGVHHLAHRLG